MYDKTICVCIYIYIYMYVCTYICIYIYIYIYTLWAAVAGFRTGSGQTLRFHRRAANPLHVAISCFERAHVAACWKTVCHTLHHFPVKVDYVQLRHYTYIYIYIYIYMHIMCMYIIILVVYRSMYYC